MDQLHDKGFVCFVVIEDEWCIYASVNYAPLVQIMACHLHNIKPLSEPMLEYYGLDPWKQISVTS